jgi:3-deoxy-D-manno-octulosonate 8-phosphate phosphatase (KDO 8-P phosphatase)
MAVATDVETRFASLGGTFVTPAAVLASRLGRVRALVCDWDGVFNAGTKGDGVSSTYSEPDSMGTNLLRYALWRTNDGVLPVAAVVSGADNPSAQGFARREHFQSVYTGVKDKRWVVDALCARYDVAPDEIAAIFDDVNDFGMAARCGVRVLVRRDASPLARDYAVCNGLCDYVTASTAHRNAVREACELMMGLLGQFDAVVASRIAWDAEYERYFAAREAQPTEVIDRAVERGERP